MIEFTSVYFTDYKKGYTADEGYNYLVLELNLKNIGNKETRCMTKVYHWEAVVDKGYIYEDARDTIYRTLIRPEDEVTRYVMFEILETTKPTEIRCYDWSESILFIVDLQDQTITTKTVAKGDLQNNELCFLSSSDSFKVDPILQTALLTKNLSYTHGN